MGGRGCVVGLYGLVRGGWATVDCVEGPLVRFQLVGPSRSALELKLAQREAGVLLDGHGGFGQ